MRVRIDRYQSVASSLGVRSWIYGIVGALSIIFGAFGGVIGLLILGFSGGTLWERRSGIFLAVFLGALPLAVGGLLVWRAFAARTRRNRYRDLAALARSHPVFDSSAVARALDMGPLEAERVLVEAQAYGIVEETHEPTAPPPALSAPPPAVSAPRDTTPAPSAPLPSDPSRWVGAVVDGAYAIERVLGAGGMGIVLAARHVRTGRRYAIKTLLPDARLSEDAVRRFEREATAASALGHPNICAVHDFNVTGGIHYMVLDLVDGETLEQRLSRVGSLEWPDAQRFGLELASALSAAHGAGLLHRDLKPQNVVLAKALSSATNGAERAVLLDFGLVKPMDDTAISRITATGSVVGTPLYMSPEQARGEAVDARSDVYELGAVIFEMITGAPPFIDRTLASVYARLLTTQAPRASSLATRSIPPAVDAVLARALAKDPSDRFPDAKSFADALAAVHEDAPGTVRLPRTA